MGVTFLFLIVNLFKETETFFSFLNKYFIFRLLEIQDDVNQIPTIELIKFLYDNYEYNSQLKEKMTEEMIKEQNNFLEVILQTNVMTHLMKWLTNKNIIDDDTLSKKEILTRIWFTSIEGSTSAFERTFMMENYWNTSIMGLQNWIYFNYMEMRKEINYLGYMENLDLGIVRFINFTIIFYKS